MKEKFEQDKYHMVAYVKDSNNRPGHVSVSLLEQKGPGSKVYHTSFNPLGFWSLVNGMTFGSIPVFGHIETNHREDLEESDHIYRIKLTEEQFKRARKAQESFLRDVHTGRRLYSVFGSYNPLAHGLSHLFWAVKSALLTREKFFQEHFSVVEDSCDIPVYPDEMHVSVKPTITDNCSSSVTHVLSKTGFSFKNPVIPTLFSGELEKQGFEKILPEDVKKIGL